jgi:cytochrome o ubiquinol oxidase subunit II
MRRADRCAALTAALTQLAGCSGVLDPAGPVGAGERLILFDSLAIMLAIVLPTIVATLVFAYWFRHANRRATYMPQWAYSGRLELLVWAIPALVILFLGGIAWTSSHLLDPAAEIASSHEPLDVEVVSLDWKWLFIYPHERVASVNRLMVPAGIPLRLRITSASVFNAFFVPRLGSQIYAMSGMVSRLNLQADHPGIYPGLSSQFSGDGFSGMSFEVRALPAAEFARWAEEVRGRGGALDEAAYRQLLQPSENVAPYTYRTVVAGLFDEIVSLRLPPGPGPPPAPSNASALPAAGSN